MLKSFQIKLLVPLSEKIMYQNKNARKLYWIAVFTIILGLAVSLGWAFDIPLLKTIVPLYVSMKLNTALGFILTGIVLLLVIKEKWLQFAAVTSVVLAVLGFTSLFQDVFGYNLGIDQLLIDDLDAIRMGQPSPGRPSPTTSLCFGLFGLIFLAIRSTNNHIKNIRQYALHLITLISFIAIVGYLFRVPASYKLSFFTSMAIHTSITLFILSIAVSYLYSGLGIIGLFTGGRIGNIMARNLFKRSLIAVLILGYVQLSLVRLDLVSIEFGIALFATSYLLISLHSLWSTAQLLNGTDMSRKKAENELIATNKNLEKIVQERTGYLTKQNKQLEDFAHIVSHNLRGPTSNLKALLYFYEKETSIEEREIIIGKFEKTVVNLGTTLDDLVEVVTIRHESKKERGKLNFEVLFSKLIDTYQGKIMESSAKITSDFSAAPTVEYSSVYLESILHNLLSNAIKYRSSDREPSIHFETYTQGDKIGLIARDNGLGIDLALNGSRLFGLHNTFHRHPEAKGVGLFITKAQVEGMGGEIKVKSEVNIGTTFEVVF